MSKRRAWFLAFWLAIPIPGLAQTDTRSTTDIARPSSPDPDRWRLQLVGGVFREAWDMNASREHLVGASVGVSRDLSRSWMLGFETHLMHVNQSPEVDAFLPAGTKVLRWRAYRGPNTTIFIEGGGGISYASNEVPGHGTRFNFVSQTGVGMARALNSRIELVGGLRWLHVSNNSLRGHSRNPDIQAVGIYFGWQLR